VSPKAARVSLPLAVSGRGEPEEFRDNFIASSYSVRRLV
jgi:hypothetical protein